MSLVSRTSIAKVLRLVVKPLAQFCVTHGIRIQDFTEFFKNALIEAAKEALEKKETKATTSRLSAITGLHRRDVERCNTFIPEFDDSRDLIRKVIGLWQSGHTFTTKSGQARVLSFGGEESEFSALVKSVSKDLNAATILYELERLSIVERSSRGIRLILDAYAPRSDVEGGFKIIRDDIHDLIQVGEENLLSDARPAQLHVRTNYDRVRQTAVPEIKQWLLKEGHAFHARARDFISRFDQDINPDLSYKGKTTGVTVTSFGRTEYKKDRSKS